MKQKNQNLALDKLKTTVPITWCPGCLNNSTLIALHRALSELIQSQDIEYKNVVLVADIGCGSKVYDFLSMNGFYALHGRVLPTALGIKTANPKLTVIGIGGDGGTYSEGIDHLIHVARYNIDITMIVANNGVFALTKGQTTSTTRKQAKNKKKDFFTGTNLNPLALAISANSSFVARGSALELNHLSSLIKAAIKHKGFSIIDVLQPCLIFNNDIKYLRQYAYKIKKTLNFEEAFAKTQEHSKKNQKPKIPLGIFYKSKRKTWGSC